MASVSPADTPVRDVMSPGVIALSSETALSEIALVMCARNVHAVLVIDEIKRDPIGWIHDEDVLEFIDRDPLTTVARDVVSQEAGRIHPEATVQEAAEMMRELGTNHLLVTQGPRAISLGVISAWDLMGFYSRYHGRAH